MKTRPARNMLGVLGGMGPLASAEFVRTIYERTLGEREQDSPVVLLYSDPTFPDRTDAFLNDEPGVLLEQLIKSLYHLLEMGGSKIVICCVTIHYLLPKLPPDLRRRVVSLLDIIYEQVMNTTEPHLLICTTGSRKIGLFEKHSRWGQARDRISLLDDGDQGMIHDHIYHLKRNRDALELKPVLESLLDKYKVNSFIAGCTEIHMLAKHFAASDGPPQYSCVDPLAIIAEQIAKDVL